MAGSPPVATVAYDDYLEAVLIEHVKHKNWRLGQCAFNVLCELRPELAEKVRGGPIDPFYCDHQPDGYLKLARFLAAVREDW